MNIIGKPLISVSEPMDLVGERTNLKDVLITFAGPAKYLAREPIILLSEPTIFKGSVPLL